MTGSSAPRCWPHTSPQRRVFGQALFVLITVAGFIATVLVNEQVIAMCHSIFVWAVVLAAGAGATVLGYIVWITLVCWRLRRGHSAHEEAGAKQPSATAASSAAESTAPSATVAAASTSDVIPTTDSARAMDSPAAQGGSSGVPLASPTSVASPSNRGLPSPSASSRQLLPGTPVATGVSLACKACLRTFPYRLTATWFLWVASLVWGLAVWWFASISYSARQCLSEEPWMQGGERLAFRALIGDVEVRQDARSGLLHIVGDTLDDVFFAQGLVHARLRLWQMEVQRRVGSGRSAEILGKDSLIVDRVFRGLQLHVAADHENTELLPEARVTLDSYVAGVNAHINSQPRLPYEYAALGIKPEAWTPQDSLVWRLAQAWDLASNMEREAEKSYLFGWRGRTFERMDELRPTYDTTLFPTTLSPDELDAVNRTWKAEWEAAQQAGGANDTRRLRTTDPNQGGDEVEEESGKDRSRESLQRLADFVAGLRASGVLPASTDAEAQARLLDESRRAARRLLRSLETNNARADEDDTASSASSASWFAPVASLLSSLRSALTPSASLFSTATTKQSFLPLLHMFRRWADSETSGTAHGASNAWACSANVTTTGSAFLANDPHLSFAAPSTYILLRLSARRATFARNESILGPGNATAGEGEDAYAYDVIGASSPGLPGIVMGRNAHIAWGLSSIGADTQDTYFNFMTTGSTTTYELGLNETVFVPAPFNTTVEYIYGTKGEVVGNATIRRTELGLVVTDNDIFAFLFPDYAIVQYFNIPFSLQWEPINEPRAYQDTTLDAMLRLNRATNWDEFRAALRLHAHPPLSFVYADRAGNVGYQMAGRLPRRVAGLTGATPMVGAVNLLWEPGAVDFDALPWVYNPTAGCVIAANNRNVPDVPWYPVNITMDWASGSTGYRARRLRTLLNLDSGLNQTAFRPPSARVNPAAARAAQLDTVSGLVLDLQPSIEAIPRASLTDAGYAVRNQLLSFDGDMRVGSAEAALFALFYRSLTAMGASEVQLKYWDEPLFILRALANERANGVTDPACRSLRTRRCSDFVLFALEAAAREANELGQPTWGENGFHEAFFANLVLAPTSLACLGHRWTSHGGDAHTVNTGEFVLLREGEEDRSILGIESSKNMRATVGAVYRQVVDWSDPDGKSTFQGTTGQSANLFSPMYDNTLQAWRTGSQEPMALTYPTSIEGSDASVLTLLGRGLDKAMPVGNEEL